jgi:hypothetical protein
MTDYSRIPAQWVKLAVAVDRAAGDRMGSTDGECSSWHWLFPHLPGNWYATCTDSLDLARLQQESDQLNAVLATTPMDGADRLRWTELRTALAAYLADTSFPLGYSLDGSIAAEVANWKGQLQAWRTWYEEKTGKHAPGPEPLPPEPEPGSTGLFGGLSSAARSLATLGLIVIAGVVLYEVAKK